MSKTFRNWGLDQALLLPPSVNDFVPPAHLSRFVIALVTEELDLSAILARYKGECGQPPYHPAMMVALLLYGYAVGVYSSRRIAKACAERVDFMAIVALDAPDFRTISEFRRRHLTALSALFMQVLKLCEQAGLVKLGHVALDGTKIKANASKHKAMSYERMSKREVEIEAEVAGWLAAAEAADAEEDKAFGADKRGDELVRSTRWSWLKAWAMSCCRWRCRGWRPPCSGRASQNGPRAYLAWPMRGRRKARSRVPDTLST